MSDWKKLETDVTRWLSTFASGKIEYRNSYQAIPGFPSDGLRSDGLLTDGNVLISVEIEVSQSHPDTKVGKYWLLCVECDRYSKVVLFHVYTPGFLSYPWRKKLGEFYAEKMRAEIPFEYVQLDYRTATDYDSVLNELKQTVGATILSEFGLSLPVGGS